MKRMLGILLATGLGAGSAQANVVCDLYNRTIDFSVDTIVSELECANDAQVREDVEAAFADFGLCDEAKLLETPTVCTRVANFVVGGLTESLPQDWECSMTQVGSQIKERIESLCGQSLSEEPALEQ